VRLAILSDVHANLEALQATLDDVATRSVARIVCLGDIVGYNADPASCIAALRASDALCVAGNHDRAVTGQITTEGFGLTAMRAVAWTRGILTPDELAFLANLPLVACCGGALVAVHGTLHAEGGCERTYLATDPLRWRALEALAGHPSGARICAYGHTHRLTVLEAHAGTLRPRTGDEIRLRTDAYYLINPGSVGQPRGTDDRRATYLVLDTEARLLTVRRVSYDRSVTRAKSRAAGLAAAPLPVPRALRRALAWGWRRMGLARLPSRAGGENGAHVGDAADRGGAVR